MDLPEKRRSVGGGVRSVGRRRSETRWCSGPASSGVIKKISYLGGSINVIVAKIVCSEGGEE